MLEMDEAAGLGRQARRLGDVPIIGDNILIGGKYSDRKRLFLQHARNRAVDPTLKGRSHSLQLVLRNPVPESFWGVSEIHAFDPASRSHQLAPCTGIDKMLRKPGRNRPPSLSCSTGVNQQALSRFDKAGRRTGLTSNPDAETERERRCRIPKPSGIRCTNHRAHVRR
jgi:hypothetical protein